MNWLLFLVLIAGWYLTVDAGISIAFRLRVFQEEEGDGKVRLTDRQRIEFIGRLVRGAFGLVLVLSAFFLASV